MSNMLHEMNQTDTYVICDVFAQMVDYSDVIEELQDWAVDESYAMNLGWAISSNDALPTESGVSQIRAAFIALLQTLDMDSLTFVDSADDFLTKADFYPLEMYISGEAFNE